MGPPPTANSNFYAGTQSGHLTSPTELVLFPLTLLCRGEWDSPCPPTCLGVTLGISSSHHCCPTLTPTTSHSGCYRNTPTPVVSLLLVSPSNPPSTPASRVTILKCNPDSSSPLLEILPWLKNPKGRIWSSLIQSSLRFPTSGLSRDWFYLSSPP